MNIVVCVRQAASGEINPFDACAYEAALQIPGGDVTLLSMAPEKSEAFLAELTRLGARRAVLLRDSAFSGADTLATAYTLSLAVKKLAPQLVLCGRQTMDGDTGQVGPELATMTGYAFCPNAMALRPEDNSICITNRDGAECVAPFPALITVERFCNLRLPSLRSQKQTVEIWDAAFLGPDRAKCGSAGSPTKVVQVFENRQDRRKCTFLPPEKLEETIARGLAREQISISSLENGEKLPHVWIVGESPREMAETVSRCITVIPKDTPLDRLIAKIVAEQPAAILWGSDWQSKTLAAQVAASLNLGLCADCTALEVEGNTLYMYRPACCGNVIAKIRCTTMPQMATLRTKEADSAPIIIGAGLGAKDRLDQIKAFAEKRGATMAASRCMVDKSYLPYDLQVGLTGKTVAPKVYLALGISGAVHHIAGIRGSGTIIAVNADKNAPIFDYADFGIVADINSLF